MMRAAIVLVLVGSRPYVASCFGYESIYPPIMVSQLAAIFSEHGTMASTMMTAFSTGWLFDGTLVLDDVRALAYTQMLAASSNVYQVWTGHPSGAFVGYYNEGILTAANGSRALGWVEDENQTCPEYGVEEICRAYYTIDDARGTRVDQFNGIGYDCRARAWYTTIRDAYEVSATSVSAWSSIYRDSTLSAMQDRPEGLNHSVPSDDHAMAHCS